jgi:hypothetical protein
LILERQQALAQVLVLLDQLADVSRMIRVLGAIIVHAIRRQSIHQPRSDLVRRPGDGDEEHLHVRPHTITDPRRQRKRAQSGQHHEYSKDVREAKLPHWRRECSDIRW